MSLQGAIKCPTPQEYKEHLPKALIDRIPVNAEDYRLDIYCPVPSNEAINAYQNQKRLHGGLCNDYHLGRKCDKDSCGYDHRPADPAIVQVMRHFSRRNRCNDRGSCRNLKCFRAHHCQQGGCNGSCSFGRNAHILNIQVARWVSPDEQTETNEVGGRSPMSVVSDEASSVTTDTVSTLAMLNGSVREIT